MRTNRERTESGEAVRQKRFWLLLIWRSAVRLETFSNLEEAVKAGQALLPFIYDFTIVLDSQTREWLWEAGDHTALWQLDKLKEKASR